MLCFFYAYTRFCRRIEPNYYDKYCVTGVAGTTGTEFYTQHTLFNLTKEFGHTVDKDRSESKTKRTAAASGYLKELMDTISHQPSRWKIWNIAT